MTSKAKHNVYLDVARQMAEKSVLTHKHGVVIVLKNKIIATGYNHSDTFYKGSSTLFSVHAEVDALHKARKKYRDNLHMASMYVVRVSNGSFKCSKPCTICENCIKEFGIKKVYYS